MTRQEIMVKNLVASIMNSAMSRERKVSMMDANGNTYWESMIPLREIANIIELKLSSELIPDPFIEGSGVQINHTVPKFYTAYNSDYSADTSKLGKMVMDYWNKKEKPIFEEGVKRISAELEAERNNGK